MLTISPPEIRDDEIQAEPTEADSFMLKLSPTRLNAKRKERNARGFNYIQLIVGMIIFVALSRIVGPPAFRMITRARSTALSANIQTAAETVRNVLAIDPSSRGTMSGTTGAPTDSLLAALTDDAPFNWEASWALTDADDSDTIRVQLIEKDATNASPATTPTPPKVNWLLNDWDAVRVHARNQDGAWACALIVLKPNADDLDADNDASVQINGADNGGVAGNNLSVANANARLRGVWYDSGQTYTAGTTDAAGEAFHCSPVASAAGTAIALGCEGVTATMATADACHTAGGAWLPAVSANTSIDPLPGGANLWGIVSGRVLTRNL